MHCCLCCPYIPETLEKHEEMLLTEKRKITFEEWFGSYDLVGPTYYDDLRACWKTAQENK